MRVIHGREREEEEEEEENEEENETRNPFEIRGGFRFLFKKRDLLKRRFASYAKSIDAKTTRQTYLNLF